MKSGASFVHIYYNTYLANVNSVVVYLPWPCACRRETVLCIKIKMEIKSIRHFFLSRHTFIYIYIYRPMIFDPDMTVIENIQSCMNVSVSLKCCGYGYSESFWFFVCYSWCAQTAVYIFEMPTHYFLKFYKWLLWLLHINVRRWNRIISFYSISP